jgi:hypothetical protein
MVAMHLRRSLLAVSFVVVLAACAASVPAGTTSLPSEEATEKPAPTDVHADPVPSASQKGVVGEVPPDLLERITADASERTGVAVADIEVVTAEAVTWPDGSLGCPQPGQMYTQALVPGYQVVLTADDEELDYRATENGSFRLCEGERRPGAG